MVPVAREVLQLVDIGAAGPAVSHTVRHQRADTSQLRLVGVDDRGEGLEMRGDDVPRGVIEIALPEPVRYGFTLGSCATSSSTKSTLGLPSCPTTRIRVFGDAVLIASSAAVTAIPNSGM